MPVALLARGPRLRVVSCVCQPLWRGAGHFAQLKVMGPHR